MVSHAFGACESRLRIVVGMVADGMSEPEIVAAYPDLEAEDVREAIRYAAEPCGGAERPILLDRLRRVFRPLGLSFSGLWTAFS